MGPITNWDDRIDSRNVLARIAELEADKDDHDQGGMMPWSVVDPDSAQELELLCQLVSGIRQAAMSGDTPEDGIFLVRDNHFSDYIKEMYLDCMDREQTALMEDLPWSCIAWSQVAEECRPDYSIIEFDGVEYYYR